jgi:hypothetical protein
MARVALLLLLMAASSVLAAGHVDSLANQAAVRVVFVRWVCDARTPRRSPSLSHTQLLPLSPQTDPLSAFKSWMRTHGKDYKGDEVRGV